jgi:predicted ATPase
MLSDDFPDKPVKSISIESLTLLIGETESGVDSVINTLAIIKDFYNTSIAGDNATICSNPFICELGYYTNNTILKTFNFKYNHEEEHISQYSYKKGLELFQNIYCVLGLYGKLTDFQMDLLENLPIGSVLVLQFPETHLTNKQCSDLGKRIVDSVNRGVQVILQTNSDYIHNGIRIAIKNRKIDPKDVITNFFTKTLDTYKITSIVYDKDGRIEHWENGFFDQLENDLDQLMEPYKEP